VITHPAAAELTEALAEVEASPPGDARATFIARVADNARATLEREVALGPAAETAAVERLRTLLDMEAASRRSTPSSARDWRRVDWRRWIRRCWRI
jgi:hypothetical protein